MNFLIKLTAFIVYKVTWSHFGYLPLLGGRHEGNPFVHNTVAKAEAWRAQWRADGCPVDQGDGTVLRLRATLPGESE